MDIDPADNWRWPALTVFEVNIKWSNAWKLNTNDDAGWTSSVQWTRKKFLNFNYPFKLHIAKPFDLFSSYYGSAYFIIDFGFYFNGYPWLYACVNICVCAYVRLYLAVKK